jgi:hypothetical protein
MAAGAAGGTDATADGAGALTAPYAASVVIMHVCLAGLGAAMPSSTDRFQACFSFDDFLLIWGLSMRFLTCLGGPLPAHHCSFQPSASILAGNAAVLLSSNYSSVLLQPTGSCMLRSCPALVVNEHVYILQGPFGCCVDCGAGAPPSAGLGLSP